MRDKKIIDNTKKYYEETLSSYNSTPQGVGWNSLETQTLRFRQLMKVCDTKNEFSILDYGCGYGALVDFLDTTFSYKKYTGFDISEEMIKAANQLHKNPKTTFVSNPSNLPRSDYVISSGIFNVRQTTSNKEWNNYILNTIDHMISLCRKGIAFNVLTEYSDRNKAQDYLYYANPLILFDYVAKKYTRNINLIQDYDLYEFTMIIRINE